MPAPLRPTSPTLSRARTEKLAPSRMTLPPTSIASSRTCNTAVHAHRVARAEANGCAARAGVSPGPCRRRLEDRCQCMLDAFVREARRAPRADEDQAEPAGGQRSGAATGRGQGVGSRGLREHVGSDLGLAGDLGPRTRRCRPRRSRWRRARSCRRGTRIRWAATHSPSSSMPFSLASTQVVSSGQSTAVTHSPSSITPSSLSSSQTWPSGRSIRRLVRTLAVRGDDLFAVPQSCQVRAAVESYGGMMSPH